MLITVFVLRELGPVFLGQNCRSKADSHAGGPQVQRMSSRAMAQYHERRTWQLAGTKYVVFLQKWSGSG